MTRTLTKVGVATAGLAGLAWVAWGAYLSRRTERIPYTTIRTLDDVEIREYPDLVVARTTAPDEGTAFERLFRYLSGANQPEEEISMTAPVTTRGEKLDMTSPVSTSEVEEGVEMSFYLPADYTVETAPEPTNEAVSIEHETAGTMAVLPFSWFATTGRVARRRRHLLETLAHHRVETTGKTFLWQYDPPWTPPFMRVNELAVPVDPETVDVESVTIEITE
ncbi:heme-binding protein [Haloarculaceae archaeon H-GB2-1]|nr:heme-binding protein [Haloarculaceae archaeon H-GB1-1]MEA5387455.1 heme-binding protein [Haloarculaceae archaeon H-GB11]MEA5408933.1 heme-binding protein [Haloarculaceae archaeon H-GB2-1]